MVNESDFRRRSSLQAIGVMPKRAPGIALKRRLRDSFGKHPVMRLSGQLGPDVFDGPGGGGHELQSRGPLEAQGHHAGFLGRGARNELAMMCEQYGPLVSKSISDDLAFVVADRQPRPFRQE